TLHCCSFYRSRPPIPTLFPYTTLFRSLKNLRTNAVRSNFADSDGNYRFSGLDPNADYEVHAEFEGAKSPVKNVSSLDSRKEMVIDRKSTRLNSSHQIISYAVFCLQKKN